MKTVILDSSTMKLLYLLLCVTYVTCFHIDISESNKDKIISGTYTQIHKIPYQAALEYKSYLLGGATIIAAKWMALAAQCLRAYKDIKEHGRFRIGTSFTEAKGKLFRISEIIVHELFDNDTLNNDIGLAQLEKEIEFNNNRRAIQIAKSDEFPKPGESMLISGYGSKQILHPEKSSTISYVLMANVIKVLEDAICNKYNTYYPLTEKMFCAGFGASEGDAGGPGIINGKLAGIISTAGYGTRPSVYTKVSKYYHWILEKTGIKDE